MSHPADDGVPEQLRPLLDELRPADDALSPEALGVARANRHSFARSFVRAAARHRWSVTTELFDIDADGRGEAVYRVDVGACVLDFVVFSRVLDESQRTDRVIAEAWDATVSLCQGPVDAGRRNAMRANVTVQEAGRADPGTLVWGRGNRSARYFDLVVDRLATGDQPRSGDVGDDAYLMRSTAFYGNGKLGLADFGGYRGDQPLGVPYRTQMLAAWLLREFSLDLVEHCARARNADAAVLDPDWRRFFGIGNATGLGLVPYVFRHPRVFDRWITSRELARAHVVSQNPLRSTEGADRFRHLLDRAINHFDQRHSLSTTPYRECPKIADDLRAVRSSWIDRASADLADHADPGDPASNLAAGANSEQLLGLAESVSGEAGSVVESLLVELDDALDAHIEQLLLAPEPAWQPQSGTCGELATFVADNYGWVSELDLGGVDGDHWFWFYSASSQEPRRGRRGVDPGEPTEMPIGVSSMMTALVDELAAVPTDEPVWKFAIEHPGHTAALDRIQAVRGIGYAEPRVNVCHRDFLPLDLQRLQLAMYGMENFSPQSTDWLRVTLYSGAPRASDVALGIDDDWVFGVKPGSEAKRQETT